MDQYYLQTPPLGALQFKCMTNMIDLIFSSQPATIINKVFIQGRKDMRLLNTFDKVLNSAKYTCILAANRNKPNHERYTTLVLLLLILILTPCQCCRNDLLMHSKTTQHQHTNYQLLIYLAPARAASRAWTLAHLSRFFCPFVFF